MKQLWQSINRKEWLFVIVIILVVLVLTNASYLYGYLNSPVDSVYLGLHAQISADVPVYYSYIKQVKDGNIFVKDLFTGEPQQLGTFNIVWFLIGLLAYFFNLSPFFAFHLSRALLTPFLLISAYLFLSYIFSDKIQRKISYIFLVFSSGLGFYSIPFLDQQANPVLNFDYGPLDLWIGHSHLFNSIYQSPHFIVSWNFIILIFLFSLLFFETRKKGYILISGLLSLIYFNFHPYYLLLIFPVLLVYLFYFLVKERKIDWQLILYFLVVLGFSLISAFYHFYLIKRSFVIGSRALQNVTPVYFLNPFLIGFGFLVPLALLGIYFVNQKKNWNDKLVFSLIWLVVGFSLVFLPTQFQSRYYQGLQIPLVIFTTVALLPIYHFLQKKFSFKLAGYFLKNKFLFIILFFLFFFMSNFFNIFRDFYYFYHQYPIFYLDKNIVKAFDWFDQQPQKEQLVLADEYLSHLIPGFSGQKVYNAHGHETLFHRQKQVVLFWFFSSNENDSQKKKWLKSQDIDFVFYSDREKRLGSFNPAEKDYLTLVYQNQSVRIYQVYPVRNQ